MLNQVLQRNHQAQARVAEMGIAERMLTQDFVDEVVKGMKKWDIKGCAVVVVPMEKGMGPPEVKLFGEREEGKPVTTKVSQHLIFVILFRSREPLSQSHLLLISLSSGLS